MMQPKSLEETLAAAFEEMAEALRKPKGEPQPGNVYRGPPRPRFCGGALTRAGKVINGKTYKLGDWSRPDCKGVASHKTGLCPECERVEVEDRTAAYHARLLARSAQPEQQKTRRHKYV